MCAALAGIAASVARGAVDPSNCGSGSTVVPAGTPLIIQYSVSEKTRGNLNAYLKAQTTTITVDGVGPFDISDRYGPIEGPAQTKPPFGWTSTLSYQLAVLDQPGDSATVTLQASSKKDSVSYTCTITAV